ncbi:MAG: alpha/beta hydrolase [Rhizobiaceae bacterium]|nr:alpha/beta hydrolase [Rhizobiaceae bacterium]
MTDIAQAALDPEAAKVLDLARQAPAPPFETGSALAARIAYNAARAGLQGDREPVATVQDRRFPTPDGERPMRLYRGVGAPDRAAPALLYLHGGGWVVGDLDSHDEICRRLANRAGCVVACPDYRLAPEHKFPAAVEDCQAALAHLVATAGDLGIDADRIAVGGDSAGGNLAAVTALLARGKVKLTAQLLIYPNTDAAQTADSYRRFAEGYGLTASTMAWFRDHYVRDAADIADWRASPLKAPDLSGAAPAFVAIAGLDILADEGEAYARRLAESGVPVTLQRWPGQIHGFVSMGRHISASGAAIDAAVAMWRRADPAFVPVQAD